MISIICVYNDEQGLNDNLVKSLKIQTAQYELLLLDNSKRRFKSAAQALNYGVSKRLKGKYIMFVHHDVDFCSRLWLEEAEKLLDSIPGLGTAGVAGMSENGRNNRERGRNIIDHGKDRRRPWEWGNPIEKPEQVQTFDECLMIVPKAIFDTLNFDEVTCNDWHLYVVDYCLGCIERGLGVYVLPMFIYHHSDGKLLENKIKILLSLGPLPKAYYATLVRLRNKHKKHFKKIYTTCGDWNFSQPVIVQRIIRLFYGGLEYFKSLLRIKYN